MIYASPLVDLKFENVELQYKRDWELIVGGLGPESLKTFGLCERNFSASKTREVFVVGNPFASRAVGTKFGITFLDESKEMVHHGTVLCPPPAQVTQYLALSDGNPMGTTRPMVLWLDVCVFPQ
ncbi:MAG: hypothetical protein BYD32DRAFT_438652 [Podila humilis]|nr:MAG: hypothetical protein BYD32DRAFT_438652 [Podila humilis]